MAMAAFAKGFLRPALTDTDHMLRAAQIADKSAGLSAPHPNCGCVIAKGPNIVAEGFLHAEGTKTAEIQALEKARDHAIGATAYLNLETYETHALTALCQAPLSRIVVGLKNPAKDLTGNAIHALRSAGKVVDLIEDEEALEACRAVNIPLLYRSADGVPFSVLKYAMTLDGKIAATGGHAAWVTGHVARERVFETRRRSSAVVVGGNTVRRDDPMLTTRQLEGHVPVRIVMSASLELPENAKLWDVAVAPTIVVTASGSRPEFKEKLVDKGVEVVEFDSPTPRKVMEYFYGRGFMSVLWECGGGLAAPAIRDGIVHKVMAFVAPKIIGGDGAPCPVGELGLTKMTEALSLTEVSFEQVGIDMLTTGYLHPIPRC